MKLSTLVRGALVALLLGTSVAFAQDEPITIRFVHAMGWVSWLPEEVEPAFEAAFPQYDLELIVPGGYTDVIEVYGLSQEQGDPPELVQVYEAGTQEMRDTDFFKPIHVAVEGLDEGNGLEIPLDDIFPPVGAYYQVDGEYYSMPWNTSTPIIYANMD
ncbi:MAG: extracellular solute-binding protein, partial [Chloroflexi bacterium]|nr:extracellular solute-binding protein [Chloroflexota bacterium]